MNILLVEDNENIAYSLDYSFKKNNYNIIIKNNITSSIDYIVNNNINLIILDVSLPDGDGFTLYEEVIKNRNIPTIFLTARDSEDDIVKGLDLGADDYITKPFSNKELMARVNRILRKTNSKIIIDDITYDINKKELRNKDELISLSGLEIKIVDLLFMNINKTISRNVLLNYIWEITGNDIDDHTITVYLKRIREKIGTDIIKTVKGIGYRIDEK